MKNAKLVWVILILMLSGNIGCKQALQQAYPSPTLIDMKAERYFFAEPDVFLTLRNKGASGKILITIRQESKVWKRIVYFDPEEERQVKVTCPGLTTGEYKYVGQPAELASPEELSGAYGGSD
jgi:hypothetical protein